MTANTSLDSAIQRLNTALNSLEKLADEKIIHAETNLKKVKTELASTMNTNDVLRKKTSSTIGALDSIINEVESILRDSEAS